MSEEEEKNVVDLSAYRAERDVSGSMISHGGAGDDPLLDPTYMAEQAYYTVNDMREPLLDGKYDPRLFAELNEREKTFYECLARAIVVCHSDLEHGVRVQVTTCDQCGGRLRPGHASRVGSNGILCGGCLSSAPR